MTPREKAKELYYKFDHNSFLFPKEAVDHAIICVDEIIKEVEPYSTDYSVGCGFWQKVKEELLSF